MKGNLVTLLENKRGEHGKKSFGRKKVSEAIAHQLLLRPPSFLHYHTHVPLRDHLLRRRRNFSVILSELLNPTGLLPATPGR